MALILLIGTGLPEETQVLANISRSTGLVMDTWGNQGDGSFVFWFRVTFKGHTTFIPLCFPSPCVSP